MLRIVFLCCSWCLSWNTLKGKNECQRWNTIDTKASSWKADVPRRGSRPIRLSYLLTEKCQHGTITRFLGKWKNHQPKTLKSEKEYPGTTCLLGWRHLTSPSFGYASIQHYDILYFSCVYVTSQDLEAGSKWFLFLTKSDTSFAFNFRPSTSHRKLHHPTSKTSYAAAGLPHIPKSLVRGRWWHVRQYCSEHVSRVA